MKMDPLEQRLQEIKKEITDIENQEMIDRHDTEYLDKLNEEYAEIESWLQAYEI